MNKFRFVLLLIMTVILIVVPIIGTFAGTSSFISLVPYGAEERLSGVLVTESSADLVISVTSPEHSPITNVWLLLVVDEDTKTNLDSITTSITAWSLVAEDFQLVTGPIPPEGSGVGVGGTYPGCERDQQYQQYVGLTIQLNVPATEKIYYTYAYLTNEITTTPLRFTLAVNAPGATDLKVLVLALGYRSSLDTTGDGKLNEHSPYYYYYGTTESGNPDPERPKFVIPEAPVLGTMVLMLAMFGALATAYIARKPLR